MKVTTDKIEHRQAFLTIEIEPPEVEKSLEGAYRRLVQKANIPGFRKGKAPRPILERYVGKKALFNEALDYLIPETYEKAVKEQNIEPYAQPHLEVTQAEPPIFKAVVPLAPEVKLGDYQHMEVAPEETAEVAEKDIDAAIEQLRHQQATWEPVERAADFEDLVVMDIESKIDDRPFIDQKKVQYQLLRESTFPAPGFAEQLVGMKKDEEREFKLKFAAEHPRADLAGKEPWFKVKALEVKQKKLPEMNDDFARAVDAKFETLAKLREQVTNSLKLGAERKTRLDFEERAIDALVGKTEVDFPPILTEVEIDRLIERQMQRWQMDRDGLEDYLKKINKTEKELREELRPLAIKDVTRSLALGKLSEAEKVEVNDAEIDAEIENVIKRNEANRAQLQEYFKSAETRDSIKRQLIGRKTVERLVEIARTAAAETKPAETKNAETKAKPVTKTKKVKEKKK
ncbi:MAG: trigger factor [Chloroflexota bacterium]|nr:trigger factor [Chloroflexota bacterium]